MKIVFVTSPGDVAPGLLRQLVEERLVAGGNIIPGVRSIYRWRGEIQDEAESVLLMETSDKKIKPMMKRLSELHPYEVPKILAFRPEDVPRDYYAWVEEETGASWPHKPV
jgi:periplasmic divalent cation tolerance protein